MIDAASAEVVEQDCRAFLNSCLNAVRVKDGRRILLKGRSIYGNVAETPNRRLSLSHMFKLPLSFLLLTAPVAVIAADKVTFNRDVRPILADKCFHCHGPDAAERQADLRLDMEESATRFREGHAAITAGDVEQSELVKRILSVDPDLQMPPPDSGRLLSDSEKKTLVQWISEGAIWEAHWSFIQPQRPALPVVKDNQWPRNAIDHFVLKQLEDKGLQPSPETEKTTWIRRVSFDLTGLPPTLEEVDAFLADDSESAYVNVVDRLLKSPRYGEHTASVWLDAARYADTDGYQNDGPRTMYRWRDWVIDAYNSNMPFDQFTIEQLAGDLLPDASLSQKVATGFNRNHRYNSEAGLVLEEFLLENAVDRVDTTSTVWMGLTLGCARCHDHKYDPFSQREYYQLISFFDKISESGRAIKFGNSEPWIVAPTDDQQARLARLDAEVNVLRQTLENSTDTTVSQICEHAEAMNRSDVEIATEESSVLASGLAHNFPFEDMEAEGISVESGKPVLREGLHGKSATVGGSGILALGKVGDVSCHTRSTISFWLRPEKTESGVIISRQDKNTRRPGFSVELRDGRLQFYIITRWIAGVGAVETVEPIQAEEWVHVALTNDGSQRAQGMQIWLNGRLAVTTVLYNTNSNTGGTSKGAVLRIGGGVYGDRFKGQVDDLRFYKRTLFDDEINVMAERSTVAEILATPAMSRSDSMKRKLIAWIVERREELQAEQQQVAEAVTVARKYSERREQRRKLIDSFPTSMVMEERLVPRDTHIRVRGVYDNYGDVVSSDVPEQFPAMPADAPKNRLSFAKWLVSGEHPLTARVAVNRCWQQYFGTGLVKTAEDFGLQGELPSHPELLDWMAVEFVESGWNVKALQKLIVLSSTYRQSSRVAPATADSSDRAGSSRHSLSDAARTTEVTSESGDASGPDALNKTALRDRHLTDPENRLLSRGPRLRLSARQLRDQALFVSGLLTADIGGPSVSPYQPEKLWEEMSNVKYQQSKGTDLYRRGLYTIWKRTVAPPSLAILDAADRESCSVRPKRTNTPLQALALLNETTFVEAARHLAVRMSTEGGDDPITFAFRCVTSRQPAISELETLAAARADYLAEFDANPDLARKLLSTGESAPPDGPDRSHLAADTMLCNVLLNLDEVVTKE